MNKVILMGRLTKDVETRYAANKPDMAIGAFCIAVDRKPVGGEKKTDFFNCIAFGKTAENIGKWFRKGSKIIVCGEINNDEYTDKEGKKQRTTKIIVNEFDFVDSKSDNKAETKANVDVDENGFMKIPESLEEELPFA